MLKMEVLDMQVNEVCRQTGLTKKAIEYYQLKGLISPKINENGYREFSDSDLSRLKEISLLRKLDLNIEEIKEVLVSRDKKQTLALIKQAKEIQTKAKLSRIALLESLINGADVNEIQDRLDILEQQSTIREKLIMAFPGYFGKYLSFHFGQFLNEPIKTEEQKCLFDQIVDFLDNMEPIQIPAELRPVLDEAEKYMDDEKIEGMFLDVQRAFDNVEAFWEENKDNIHQYIEFKQSDEYRNSVMGQLMDLFRHFLETSGYYEVFIPAMRKLSPVYDSYYKKLMEANEKLLRKMAD